MIVEVIPGLPLLRDKEYAFILNIHDAIAAYAATLGTDRTEYCFYRLKTSFRFSADTIISMVASIMGVLHEI
jgi:hypothetical protein